MTSSQLDLSTIAAGIAGKDQPFEVFRAAEKLCDEMFSTALFSLLSYDPQTGDIERIYSSDVERFPTGVRKAMGDTDWSRSVLKNGQTWFGDLEAIKQVFPDWQKIMDAGIQSSLCMPIRWRARTLGMASLAFNDVSFDRSKEADIMPIAAMLALGFLSRYHDI